MTNTEAHAVIVAALRSRLAFRDDVFNGSTLQILDPYVNISADEFVEPPQEGRYTTVTLDGSFSPELLEAIVCYIKDRKGVANAHEHG